MGDTDETAEHAEAVGIARKDRDAGAVRAEAASGFPAGTGSASLRCGAITRSVRLRDIAGQWSSAAPEEAAERFPRRQLAGRYQLPAIERNARAVEVNGGDGGGLAGLVGRQPVKIAQSERPAPAVEAKAPKGGLRSISRVLPDLRRWTQPAEEVLEQPPE